MDDSDKGAMGDWGSVLVAVLVPTAAEDVESSSSGIGASGVLLVVAGPGVAGVAELVSIVVDVSGDSATGATGVAGETLEF